MKRILLISIILFFSRTSFAYHFSAVCSTGQTLYYNIISDSTVSVTFPYESSSPYYSYTRPTGNLVIPDSVFHDSVYYKVISIGNYAFDGCYGIQRIVIPDNVTSIGTSAFYGCSGIQSLVIPDNVTIIEHMAFGGCNNIDSLYIGVNVTFVDPHILSIDRDSLDYVFFNCKNANDQLTHEDCFSCSMSSFPNTVTDRGNRNYIHPILGTCKYVKNLIIGDSVQIIPQGTFYGFRTQKLYLGNNLVNIKRYALQHTCIDTLIYNMQRFSHALRDSSYDYSGGYYSSYHYYYSSFLGATVNTLIIGDDVEIIPSGAFQTFLFSGEIVIPNNVTTIGAAAFYRCCNIDSIYIGSNVSSIGGAAFGGCSTNRYVYFNARNCIFTCTNAFGSPANLTIDIGDSVRVISEEAFMNTNIHSLSLSSLDTIKNRAFYNCDSIVSISLNPKYIGDRAFGECGNLRTAILGEKLHVIKNGVFTNCVKLNNVSFIGRIDSIENDAFYDCRSLQSFIFNNVRTIGSSAFADCDSLLTVNTNAHSIGSNAFANCDRLVSVTLGDSVQALGNGVFGGCFRLNNVSLGEGITSIGDSAFGGCIRLTKPELPNSLTTIGTRAFDGCGDINGKLTFPASITHIGDYAYNGVGNITEIEMKGSTPPTIHAHTFAAVDSLVTVSVPCGAVMNYYITDYWENFPNIVEAPPYRLTVSSNNEVMGTATVTQQPTCSNHNAIIQATANASYHFHHWSDGVTVNPRQISMTCDSTFEAIFIPNLSYIEVVCNDSTMGSVTGTGTYNYNAPVILTATSYTNYHFLCWNDGNTQNPRYLMATQDSIFTAIFVSNVSTISVGNNNPGWGTVNGSGIFYYQNQVVISATPVYGYHFTQWNDGNTQNPRTITVNQDSTFIANFAVNIYSISAVSNNTVMGTVTGGGSYNYLSETSLSATPNLGYHFVQWNDGITNNPRSITVTRDSLFTAQFASNTYQITVNSNDPSMGSAYGSGTYSYNTTITISATPVYGYHFVQWSDGNNDNPRTVTVLQASTYTAQFAINTYTITVNSSNPSIGSASGGGSFNYNTPISISATPNTGYHFTQWSDANTDNPRLITVTQNATYTAQFSVNTYAITVNSNNSTRGSVSGSGSYTYNTTATISASPFYGYHFTQWNDGNTDNPRTIVVSSSDTYTAQFDPNSYTVLGLSSDATIGSVTGGGTYPYATTVSVTGVPMEHYHFVQWTDSIINNPRTFVVTRDTVFTAQFAIDTHTITVVSAQTSRGSVSGGGNYAYGTGRYISATANYGYHFSQWSDGNTSNPRRIVVTSDSTFTAQFAPNTYVATVTSNDTIKGIAIGSGNYDYLTSISLVAVPNYGYHFVQWSDGDTHSIRTLVLTQDTVLTAQFAFNTYYIHCTSNDSLMGTVSGGGSYNYLTQVTLSATANEHYHFVQWNDGNTTNPRLITLTSDTTFIAQFEEDARYSITVNSNDPSMGTVAGSGVYYGGEQVILTATPRDHYHFVQWGDGNTQNPRTITVVGDADYTAVFEADIYTITVTANNPTMGSVMGGGEYGYGTEVTIAAQPFAGFGFRGWSDGDTNRERTIVVTEDADYQAIFYDMVGINYFGTANCLYR